jgi:hypothetical protein
LASVAKLALGLWELSTVHTNHLYFSPVLASYHPSLINYIFIYFLNIFLLIYKQWSIFDLENILYIFSVLFQMLLLHCFWYLNKVWGTMYLHVLYVLGRHWLWRAIKFNLVYRWLGGEKEPESVLKECFWDRCNNHTIHCLHERLIGMTFIC